MKQYKQVSNNQTEFDCYIYDNNKGNASMLAVSAYYLLLMAIALVVKGMLGL